MTGHYIILVFQLCRLLESSLISLSGLTFCVLLIWLGRVVSSISFPLIWKALFRVVPQSVYRQIF